MTWVCRICGRPRVVQHDHCACGAHWSWAYKQEEPSLREDEDLEEEEWEDSEEWEDVLAALPDLEG